MTMETLESFRERHGLELKVLKGETDPSMTGYPSSPRVIVYFYGAETKSGNILSGESGIGETQEQAEADYARRLSGKLLIVNAMDPVSRREIRVPRLGVPPIGAWYQQCPIVWSSMPEMGRPA